MYRLVSFEIFKLKVYLIILLSFGDNINGYCQTYGTSISEATFENSSCNAGSFLDNCPTPNTNYIGSVVRLGIMDEGIENNLIRFTFIQQCPPGNAFPFSNGATAWLKEDGVCGPVVGGPYNVPIGAYGQSNMVYHANFSSGQRDIWVVVEIPNGNRYYGGPITVYAPPLTPRLSSVNPFNNEYWVYWNDVTNADGYYICRADCSSCTYYRQDSVPANISNYIDNDIECGKSYCYKVTAFSNDGVKGTISGFSNAKCGDSIKPFGLSPGTQNRFSGEQINNVTPTLSWNSLQGATNYAVVVRDRLTNQVVLQETTGSATSYSIDSGVLQHGKSYQWGVGVGCNGNDAFSNKYYFTTPPASPPFIQFTTCTSISPSVIATNNNINFVTEISNTGGSVWGGDIRVVLEEIGNAANNEIIYSDNHISLTGSESYDINISPTIDLSNGDYRIYVQYKTDGNGFWNYVNKGNCIPQNSSTHYGELEILMNVPGSLAFDDCISAPNEVEQGQIISGQVVLRNIGTETWSGNLDIFVDKKHGNYTAQSIYHATNQNITGGNSITINFGDDGVISDTITGQAGDYYIFVAYTNAPDGCCNEGLDYVAHGECVSNYLFSQTGTESHRHTFLLTPEGQGSSCDITTPNPDNLNEEEAHTASTYLCSLGILDDPANGNTDPYQNINRGQLAKILYYALLGRNTAPTIASTFPTPFLDLIDETEFYYHPAKALSYLQYDDVKTPFDREFINFNPTHFIKRGHLLKALLETFNERPLPGTIPVAGVSPNHEMYGYVNRACVLGLIDCDNLSYQFLPDKLAQRYEAFILVWRYLINHEPPNVQHSDFFSPLNVTPENMGKNMGFADASFKHHTRTSFAIPGKKIPLVFEHVYNSFAVDLPEEIYQDYEYPLGKGWSHSYHCYIQKFEDYDPDSTKLVVFWPGNSLNVYNDIDLSPITKNIYDDVTDNGSTITIKKKNQVIYTFNRLSSNSNIWLLASIKDRNNNAVQLFYQNYTGAKKRLHKVRGTAGREIKFFYEDASHPSFITRVEDPQRNVRFTYQDMDLKTYQDPAGKKTTYNYGTDEETAHLLLSIQLPKGNTITNTYEERKLNSTSSNNQTITGSWQWTPNGATNRVNMPVTNGSLNIDYTQNRQGNTTNLQVRQGNASPLNTMDIQYNDPDNPYLPTYVNINDDIINYQYDDIGNVEQISLPLGITHQFTYTNLNDVDYYIDPRGNLTDFAYDGTGNLRTITDPLGNTTSIDYFVNGLVKKVTNPESITVNYTYDNFGNLETINTPEGIQIAMSYDILGRMKTYTDPNGNVTTTFFDSDDLVNKVFNAAGNVSDYTYDNNNNLTEIKNANGETTTLAYDFEQDWLISQSFGGKTDEFEYYPDGRLHTHTDPNGHTDTYIYDAQGRLQEDGYATYEYYSHPNNQLWKVTNNQGTVEFTYDTLNRVKTIKDFYNNTITYDYDLNSNIEKIHYPDGKQVTYVYDAANRLTSVVDWNNNATAYDYYKDGRLKRMDYPNGTYAQYYYDDAGRMTGLGNFKSETDTINFYSYILDPSGNHLQVTQIEPFGNFNWNSGDTIATYDETNRIETFGGLDYQNDENGNITNVDGDADYNFHWDTEDQMIQLDSAQTLWASYTYDGLGHRRRALREGIPTRYVLDILGMSKVLMETDDNNNPAYYYIHGLGQIARVDASGNYHYYHYDYRGSTIAMTNTNKTITHQYQYGPYGENLQSVEADFNAYRYVGAYGVQYEKEDIYFMRARYYDVQAKRFISEDPIWAENLYGYAGENPVTQFDPNGEQYISPQDKALFEKYADPNKAIIENLGGVLIDDIVEGNIKNVAYLISEVSTVQHGAQFLRYGNKLYAFAGKSLVVVEIVYDAYFNPEYWTAINEGYSEEKGLIINYREQILKLNEEIDLLFNRYNDDKFTSIQKEFINYEIIERVKERRRIHSIINDIFETM